MRNALPALLDVAEAASRLDRAFGGVTLNGVARDELQAALAKLNGEP